MVRLENRTALVIGAGSGIGRATTIELARRGADVIVASKTEKKVKDTVNEIKSLNKETSGLTVDITKESSVQELRDRISERYAKVDILINSAAVSLRKPFNATTIEEWDNTINTNVRGQFIVIKTLLPLLTNAIIINISSILGRYALRDYSAYCASKFAVIGFSKALAKELPNKIYVVCPGAVDTPMYRRDNPKSRRKVLEPDYVAKRIVDLCDSRKKSGSVVEVLGRNELYGLSKLWW